MARNRMIKVEFWSSQSLARVSRESRFLFVGLWNIADDYGVILGSVRRILGELFPYDDDILPADIERWIDELIEIGSLEQVEYKGGKYYIIPAWEQHQKVDNPSQRRFIKEGEEHLIKTLSKKSRESLDSVSRDSSKSLPDKRERETEREREEVSSSLSSVDNKLIADKKNSEEKIIATTTTEKKELLNLAKEVAQTLGINKKNLIVQIFNCLPKRKKGVDAVIVAQKVMGKYANAPQEQKFFKFIQWLATEYPADTTKQEREEEEKKLAVAREKSDQEMKKLIQEGLSR